MMTPPAILHDVRGVAYHPFVPRRLISLVPSTTETLFALGCGDALIGYTRFCVHPRDQIASYKWIGGTKNPKLDWVIALRPDLVLANREENREEDITALEAAGLSVWVAEPRTVEAAIEDIRELGILVGRSEAGQRLADDLEATLADVRRHRSGPPRTVAYLIWRDPYMVAGSDTFIADMLAQGGFVVPFAGRYPIITIDDLNTVDFVFLASEPFPFSEKYREEMINRGIPAEKLRLVDGELLSWHGVRLLEGLPYVRQLAVDS